MLITFSVSNYLSFKDKHTISLVPDSLKEHDDYLHIPYLYDLDARVLKSMSIYGHNSHGKSNFLKAFQFFQNFIFSSFTLNVSDEAIPVQNFSLNVSTIDKPSFFEVVFYLKKVKYRYGFEVTTEKVFSEWLYYAEAKVRENCLFERVEQEIKISKSWNKESENKIDHSVLFAKPKNLLLSVLVSQENIPRIEEIANWLRGNIIITDINDEIHLKRTLLVLAQPIYQQIITKFLHKADLGFTSIIDKIDSLTKKRLIVDKELLNWLLASELKSFEIYTKHDVWSEDYKSIVDSVSFELLKSESSGSIKFLILAAYLSYIIKQGQIIWIDEIDASLHVDLLKAIVIGFNNAKVNSTGAQMIFTTHNTVFLTNKHLRRDQVTFVEKNSYGESRVKRMHTSKTPVRIDTQVEKEYINGKLGGVSKKFRFGDEEQHSLFD